MQRNLNTEAKLLTREKKTSKISSKESKSEQMKENVDLLKKICCAGIEHSTERLWDKFALESALCVLDTLQTLVTNKPNL